MGFLKLLNIGLILISTTVSCIADTSESTYRLPNYIRPLNYNIRLFAYVNSRKFYGSINITFEITTDTAFPNAFHISLHSQGLKIYEEDTTLKYRPDYILPTSAKPTSHIYNRTIYNEKVPNILTLTFDSHYSNGTYILHMEFRGNITESRPFKTGFLEIPHREGDLLDREEDHGYVTLLAPNSTRRVFPCFDEPALKATFDISVLHPQVYKVFSNMPERSREPEALEPNMNWTIFHTTPVMSTNLVGIVMKNIERSKYYTNNYAHVSNDDKSVNVWTNQFSLRLTENAKFILNFADKVFTPLLVKYTNISVKIPKTDHYMDHSVTTTQHWGLIIYNELDVKIYNEDTDSIFQKHAAALTVAHQLVQQWFGNLVTPSWWSYQWLSDGFAVFFKTYFLNKVYQNYRLMDLFVVKQLHYSLAIDNGLMPPITLEPNKKTEYDIFGTEIYYKAAVILRMLHHTITNEVFQKGIRIYLDRHQFGSVTPDDLWSAMQSALNESHTVPDENYKIKEVMDTWTKQNRYPILNVTRKHHNNEVTVTQKCYVKYFRTNDDTDNKWWIPITFATQSNPDFSNTVPRYWVRPDNATTFTANFWEWIIINVQQTVYCRVYYDIRNWRNIVRDLNSEFYTRIHVLNRAQLVDDAHFFFNENQLDKDVFFNIINYLQREKDYIPWAPMFRILTSLSPYYPLPESESFKAHMVHIIDKLLQNIGYEEDPGDSANRKMLRLEAMKWACTFGHNECKRTAGIKLNEILINYSTNPHIVRTEWQDWTYCFGLTYANKSTWDIVFQTYNETQDKKFWKYLSCSENSDIIIHYLRILKQFSRKSSAIDVNPLFDDEAVSSICKIIIEKHANNGFILDYLFRHLSNRPSSVTTGQLMKFYISNISSNEQIEKLERYSRSERRYLRAKEIHEIRDLIEKRKKYLTETGNYFANKYSKMRIQQV